MICVTAILQRAAALPSLSALLEGCSQSVAVESELQSISSRAAIDSSSHCSGSSGSSSSFGGGGGGGGGSVSPSSSESDRVLLAGVLASIVVRRASGLAFSAHGRSVTAPDVVDKIGQAFQNTIDE